jgi:hypothetical protein
VKSDALSDQLITFTRCLREALPIKYRDLPSAYKAAQGQGKPASSPFAKKT